MRVKTEAKDEENQMRELEINKALKLMLIIIMRSKDSNYNYNKR